MSVLASSLAFLAMALPPQQPIELGPPKAVSHPGGPGGAYFSADGTKIWTVQGTEIVALNREDMTACELALSGPCTSDGFEIDGTHTEIDAPILDIEDYGGTLYVAAGDSGVIRVTPQTGGGYLAEELFYDPPPPSALTRRWCFDVEVTSGGTHLLALFSALTDSKLVVIPLTSGQGHSFALSVGRGYAVESFGTSAYLAMGSGGLWRIPDWTNPNSTPEQGPANFGPGGPVYTTVRDLAIAAPHRYLVAAGDSLGLIEVDLTKPWNSQGSYRWSSPAALPSSCENMYAGCTPFGLRVDALHDATSNRLVIALASDGRPIERQEWGPYTSFSTYLWNEGNPYVPPGPVEPYGCPLRVDLYERPFGSTGWAQQALTSCPGDFGLASLELVQEPSGRFWTVFGDYALAAYARDASGNLLSIGTNEESNVFRDGQFGLGALSLRNPDVAIFGRDGSPTLWGTPGIEYLAGGGIEIKEVAPPCVSNPISLVYRAQWTETEDPGQPNYPYEWGVSSGFKCPWPLEDGLLVPKEFYWTLHRMNMNVPDPNATWQRWGIHLPDDPVALTPCAYEPSCSSVLPQVWNGYAEGFGHNFAALDPRVESDLLAISRRAAVHGVVLYRHSEIQEFALASAGTTCGPSPVECPTEIFPTHLRQLNTHPTLDECSCYLDEIFRCRCIHTQFFTMRDHLGDDRSVLGVAAGWETNPSSGNFNQAKFVFFDVTNCLDPDDPACGTMPQALVSLPAMGGEGGAYAFWFDAATIGDISYLFLGDFAGRVLVADATHLFDVGAGSPVQELATWSTPLNVLDGLRDRITEVHFDPFSVTEGVVGQLYLAANRLGLVRLDVTRTSNPHTMALSLDELVETPGQAAGMAFGEKDGKRRLLLGDHLPTGLRAYGEF